MGREDKTESFTTGEMEAAIPSDGHVSVSAAGLDHGAPARIRWQRVPDRLCLRLKTAIEPGIFAAKERKDLKEKGVYRGDRQTVCPLHSKLTGRLSHLLGEQSRA